MNRRYKKNNTKTIRISKGAYDFFKDQLVDRGIPGGPFVTIVDLVVNEFNGLRKKEQNRQKKIEEADLGFL